MKMLGVPRTYPDSAIIRNDHLNTIAVAGKNMVGLTAVPGITVYGCMFQENWKHFAVQEDFYNSFAS